MAENNEKGVGFRRHTRRGVIAQSVPDEKYKSFLDSIKKSGMRVGDDFQASIPEYIQETRMDGRSEAMLVWAPKEELSETKIDEYIQIAKEKHGYNTEQALGMLFWHKHNVEKALSDLPNFTPFPDEWSVEDKVLFEQAFGFHGKSFHRIRQMLPDKSIASLVKYYYAWKKTRSRTSLMDRQAKRLASQRDDSDEGSDDGSANSDAEAHAKENGKEDKNGCCNCGFRSTQLHHTPKGSLCATCYQHWRKTGGLRPAGQRRHESQHTGRPMPFKHKRKPPRGMYLNKEDLSAMVSGPPGQDEAILKGLDTDLVSLKRCVQNNKQMLSLQKHKMISGISQHLPNTGPQRLVNKWTNEELLLAVQGVRKYGKDYKAIAEVIGNKSESHIRSFFQTFRRRYNLDEVLAEYEAEHGSESIKEEEDEVVEQMEVEKPESSTASVSQSNGTAATPEPPPLLKQSTSSGGRTHHYRLLPPSKTVLAQPPPLIRPSSSPAGPSSAPPVAPAAQPME